MAGNVDHGSRAHAPLSASGSSKWINCSPSAKLEQKFPDKSSIHADEGTLAHEISEVKLRLFAGYINEKVANTELKKLRRNKLYYDGMDTDIDVYVQYVKEKFTEVKTLHPEALLLIERRLDFSHLVEKGFGTGDILIVTDNHIFVIDLKFGKGVEVSAVDNSQLKIYGLGALYEFEMMYDIESLTLVIVQPRKDNISEWEISAEDLVKWGEDVVRPRALLAFAGEGQQKVGSWCRFCKAKPICRAHAEENLKLAKLDFRDPWILSDDEILMVKNQSQVFKEWIESVTDYMTEQALSGKTWEGYKLVHGKSDRRWGDELKVIQALSKKKLDVADYISSKLKGIGAIETLLGADEFNKLVGPYVIKPTGAPTLALLSDKRPGFGIEQAKADFADEFTVE